MPRKYVPPAILNLIHLGDQVIQQVKQLLPFGAGNQQFDYYRTNQNSSRRTALAQRAYGTDWSRPLRNAGATLAYQAGNCQDQASVTYALLREQLNNATYASFCQSTSYHHSFAAIGDPNDPSKGPVVIVDPWPQQAQAVLLEDHFTSDHPILTLRSKVGGRVGKIAKAQSKYTGLNVAKDTIMELFHNYPLPQYNQTHCTKNNVVFEYHDNLIEF